MAKQAGELNAHRLGATQTPRWELWCMWVLASLAAGTVAPFLFYVGRGTESLLVGISAMFGLLLVPGVVLGALQLLALRRQVEMAGTWVLITALGWAVGWAFGFAVGAVVGTAVGGGQLIAISGNATPAEPWSEVVTFGIGGVIAGLVMGGLQGTVLRPHVARIVVWVLASTVAMAVGGVSVGVLMWWGPSNFPDNYSWSAALVYFLGAPASYGAITGYSLMLLLRQRSADARASTTEKV